MGFVQTLKWYLYKSVASIFFPLHLLINRRNCSYLGNSATDRNKKIRRHTKTTARFSRFVNFLVHQDVASFQLNVHGLGYSPVLLFFLYILLISRRRLLLWQAVADRWAATAWFSERLDGWDTPAQYAARQPAAPYFAYAINSNAINSTGLGHGMLRCSQPASWPTRDCCDCASTCR